MVEFLRGYSEPTVNQRRVRQILGRGLSLTCPRCGVAPLFRGPFTMYPECLSCDLEFEREQGYFVGAIYVNYAVTAVLAILGYVVVDHLVTMSLAHQLILWGTFAVGFPLFFFRYSRSLWLSVDYLVNPDEARGNAAGGPRR